MKDLRERRDQCIAQAGECEMIALLATDLIKRENFRRLADHLRQIARDIDGVLDAPLSAEHVAGTAQSSLPFASDSLPAQPMESGRSGSE